MIAVALPNRLELVVIMFAAWRLGAAVTPVNPGLTDAEARHQIEDSGAKVVITDDRGMGTLDVAAFADTPADRSPDAVSPASDALALIIYTSGTTGRPKGVMLDHANIAAMCRMIVDGIGLDETDHSLLVLPLFHVNGIVVSVLSPLLAGGRATIAGRFRAPAFFASVEAAGPTYFSAVPAIYAMLVSLPDDVRPDTSSLRRAICGAAPMPAELIARFENRFGVPVVEGYGLSEGTCASTLNPPAGPRRPGTVGLPLPGQTVAVMDAEGHLLDAGSVGEVVVRGPNVMRGYLGLPDETARTVVDGWLHTGDVGRFDTDGHLVLVDRIKDMIIRGGENIYPKEIENVLHTHPAVLEAAVVGAPEPVLGEVPVAYVTLLPGAAATAEELVDHCRGSLARVKVPVSVVVTESLPKNPVGKIDKPRLRSFTVSS
ncbi:long-chain-fatty-acid--CoA ligase [Streptomyces flaveus]|uniref:Long-chain-fatty-acid--CoA ligase n=1 Tax=Streptomyces flaveus TaxID=66370 RepID=A0A917RA97_9ACTN|nr:long-chain-fatty-acid--CoA ligase [Streptomyces flaveus]